MHRPPKAALSGAGPVSGTIAPREDLLMPKAPLPTFHIHPSIQMVVDWTANLKGKTGRSLDEWLEHIKKSGPADEAARRDWLKQKYDLGTNTAWWLAEKATHPEKLAEDTPEGYLKLAPKYVDDQYTGKKATLRPIYEAILSIALKLEGVKVCPCKTMVPLYREHVFAQIKPTTNTRIDLGLALAALPESKIPKKRIISTGGREKKDRITHRIEIASVGDIDGFVEEWLLKTYELDAPVVGKAAKAKPMKKR